jgi:hypothetical protein
MDQEILNKLEHVKDEIAQIEEDIRVAREKKWETHELYKARNRCHEQCDELNAMLRRPADMQGPNDLTHPQIILSTAATRRKQPDALRPTLPITDLKCASYNFKIFYPWIY